MNPRTLGGTEGFIEALLNGQARETTPMGCVHCTEAEETSGVHFTTSHFEHWIDRLKSSELYCGKYTEER